MQPWEPEDWIALASVTAGVAVGLGSLAFSFFTLRHNRAEGYRAALYARQLEGVLDLADAVSRLHSDVLQQLENGVPPTVVTEVVRTALAQVRRTRIASAPALPNAALGAGLHYESAVESALSSNWAGGDRVLFLDAMYIRFVEAVREELGVDELGERIRQLTGLAERQRKQRVSAELDEEIQTAVDSMQED